MIALFETATRWTYNQQVRMFIRSSKVASTLALMLNIAILKNICSTCLSLKTLQLQWTQAFLPLARNKCKLAKLRLKNAWELQPISRYYVFSLFFYVLLVYVILLLWRNMGRINWTIRHARQKQCWATRFSVDLATRGVCRLQYDLCI